MSLFTGSLLALFALVSGVAIGWALAKMPPKPLRPLDDAIKLAGSCTCGGPGDDTQPPCLACCIGGRA